MVSSCHRDYVMLRSCDRDYVVVRSCDGDYVIAPSRHRDYVMLRSCVKDYVVVPSCYRDYVMLRSCDKDYVVVPSCRIDYVRAPSLIETTPWHDPEIETTSWSVLHTRCHTENVEQKRVIVSESMGRISTKKEAACSCAVMISIRPSFFEM
jgi:hypothetical protein